MEEKKLHRDCAPHTAAECDINDHDNLDPGLDDCGHTVSAGPGVGMPPVEPRPFDAPDPTAPGHNGDQDPDHGPGVA